MDFNTLLTKAQKLINETQTFRNIPRVERTIPQILIASQELHARVTESGTQDSQANILLGSKGFDLPKISQKLESLSARQNVAPLDPIVETDVQSFLKNEKENAILSVIEEIHKNSYKTTQKIKWQHIQGDWRQEKVKLMNALVGPSQNWINIQKTPEQTILNESSMGGKSTLDRIEMAYVREIIDYNKLVIDGALKPNLVHIFLKLAEKLNSPKVTEMWEIIKYMVNVTSLSKNHDPITSRVQMTEFIGQAKTYLEKRYKLFMSTVITANLREAERGGIPATYNLVSSYVGLKFKNPNSFSTQEGCVDGKPLWALIYFSLRCGDYKSALSFLQKSGIGNEDFCQALTEKCASSDAKLAPKLENQLKLLYCNKIKNSPDAFKKVSYCIIGGCDLNEQHLEVAKTTDDFLWIQLSLLQLNMTESNSEALTYSGLQTMISEKYGEQHFNAAEQSHLYFQLLALTGQFEAAIEFLSRTHQYRVHAVHMALALNELHIISGPRNIQEPLLSVDIEDPPPMRRLNVARLVMLYVKKFEITDPAEALQYFFFLRNLKDPEGRNFFLVCVSDLAVESRDYNLLFGKMSANGMKTRGLFDQFESINFTSKTMTKMVANSLINKGLFEDAIKLYDLAGDFEHALTYVSILLSQVVHQVTKPDSLRERLQILVVYLNERLKGEGLNCDKNIIATFGLLSKLMAFFDCYHEKKYQVALEIIDDTKLIPLTTNDLESCVSRFKQLSGEINKVYPDILLAVMDVLHNQYIQCKGIHTGFNDTSKESQLKHLREKAKSLTNMAATIPYRMPGDTNSRLVQIEILMN